MKATPFRSFGDLVMTSNARADKADLTNAKELFGDPFEDGDIVDFGDIEDGDADSFYGDADVYGDPDSSILASYDMLVGDADEMGDTRRRGFHLPKGVKIAGAAALGLGGTLLAGRALNRAIAKNRMKKLNTAQTLRRAQQQQTIQTQLTRRRNMGKLPRTAGVPFFTIMGATLNAAPIAVTEAFAADTLKYNLDRQATDTPFDVEVVQGTYSGSTWTVQSVGVAGTRYYICVVINIGINTLAGNPGTIFNVTGTMPTFAGPLTISTYPFSLTLLSGFDAKMMIFPWQLVTNKPLPVLGTYSNTNAITFAINGIPSNAAVSMVIPGSLHPWTIGTRNRLVRM